MWKVCGFMIVLTWLISATTLLPFFFGLPSVGLFSATPLGQCGGAGMGPVGVSLLSANTYIPYAFVTFATVAVLGKLLIRRIGGPRVIAPAMIAPIDKASEAPRLGMPSQRERKQLQLIFQKRVNLAKMLLLSFLFCLACTLPLPIVSGFYPWAYGRYPLLSLWLRILMVAQSALTPVNWVKHFLKM